MKIRNGFVSNSSSSSFILVGIKPTAEQRSEFRKRHPDEDIDGVHDMEGDYADLIGIQFYGWEHRLSEFTIGDLQKAVDKVKAEFGPDADVKLYHGERYDG